MVNPNMASLLNFTANKCLRMSTHSISVASLSCWGRGNAARAAVGHTLIWLAPHSLVLCCCAPHPQASRGDRTYSTPLPAEEHSSRVQGNPDRLYSTPTELQGAGPSARSAKLGPPAGRMSTGGGGGGSDDGGASGVSPQGTAAAVRESDVVIQV